MDVIDKKIDKIPRIRTKNAKVYINQPNTELSLSGIMKFTFMK